MQVFFSWLSAIIHSFTFSSNILWGLLNYVAYSYSVHEQVKTQWYETQYIFFFLISWELLALQTLKTKKHNKRQSVSNIELLINATELRIKYKMKNVPVLYTQGFSLS